MDEASKKILFFYDRHINEFGSGPQAVGWNDRHSQEARFAAMCRVGDLDDSLVLDVGCGLGDFYAYLSRHYRGVAYVGIDINPRYIEQARQIYPDARFEVADIEAYMGGPFDYICASGVFAVKIADYKQVYFAQIKKMFEIARKGIAFTMLDEAEHPNDEEYAAYSVDDVRDFCRTLSEDVVVHHDYLPHDFTVIVGKNVEKKN